MIHVPFNAETVSNGVKCHQRGFQADFGHETQNGEPQRRFAQAAEAIDENVEGVHVSNFITERMKGFD